MSALRGREAMVALLVEHVLAGHTVLVYGPWCIGKTALLDEVQRRVAATGRPCALAPHTNGLADITAALARACPDARRDPLTQRHLRTLLRNLIAQRPGALLLDHAAIAGTAVKGYLRSLAGLGLGVVLAVDAENERDHGRARAWGLAYREVAVPRLGGSHMARLLDEYLRAASVAVPLQADDRAALLDAAQGRPGWLVETAFPSGGSVTATATFTATNAGQI